MAGSPLSPKTHRVRGHTGYLIHPALGSSHRFLALGHTAQVDPWRDAKMHVHLVAEEVFLLLAGRLTFAVADFVATLQPNELLLIRPGVPHAITGGAGAIEHIGIRVPAVDDKQEQGELPLGRKVAYEHSRLVSGEWGFRVPLDWPQHKNCWVVGAGKALFHSAHMSLAYIDFPTLESANAGIGTRHRLHLHRESWEYYLVLQGDTTLLVEDRLLTVPAGELLEVPPWVRHTLHSRRAPYLGVTTRVPLQLDDRLAA